MITSEQVRAARGLIRWEQKDLSAASGISLPAIKRLEQLPGPLAAQSRTVEAIIAAFEKAGVEFTNGGQPGVKATPLWMLHRVAERANLDEVLKMKGRDGYWKISPTAAGLECKNQHGEIMGSVVAGRPDDPAPKFDPDMEKLTFPDRVTPTELQRWVAEMLKRDCERGLAAHAFDPPVVSGEDRNTENDGGAGVRFRKTKGKQK